MKVAIIGCGNMGITYARSFIQYAVCSKAELSLIEKNQERQGELEKQQLGAVKPGIGADLKENDIIVLAVKPQDYKSVQKELKENLTENNTILSIMAGIRIKHLEETLNHELIVRAMPNLPARLGMGITGFTGHASLSRHHLSNAERLLNTTGRALYLEDESLLDSVTALSGSGPAYFFYIIKNMVEAGIKMGLDEANARLLAKQTMLGSYHLLNNTDESLEKLIQSVCSKGGTTEAAFEVFEKGKMGDTLIEAILRAEERARELSDN